MRVDQPRNARVDDRLLGNARGMRQEATDSERKLWSLLRNRRLGGFKFRRQHPVGPYIVDFYCDEAKLGVEVDGSQHMEAEAIERDAARADYLRSKGIVVLRFWSNEALRDSALVAERILEEVTQRAQLYARPHPCPLPEGEGEKGAAQ